MHEWWEMELPMKLSALARFCVQASSLLFRKLRRLSDGAIAVQPSSGMRPVSSAIRQQTYFLSNRIESGEVHEWARTE